MAWSKTKKLNFINKEPVIRVATIGKNNRPQVTPVCHVVSRGKIYWASDFDAAKLANIKRHPWVSLVADEYRATWKNMGGVMFEGRRAQSGKARPFARSAACFTASSRSTSRTRRLTKAKPRSSKSRPRE